MIDGRWIESHQKQERLGEILLRMAALNTRDLQTALGVSRERGQLIGQTLVDLDLVTSQQVREALLRQRGQA
jgi:hypothetical protein